MCDEKGDFLDDIKRHCGFAKLHHVLDHESIELAVNASFSDLAFNGDKVVRKAGIQLF